MYVKVKEKKKKKNPDGDTRFLVRISFNLPLLILIHDICKIKNLKKNLIDSNDSKKIKINKNKKKIIIIIN